MLLSKVVFCLLLQHRRRLMFHTLLVEEMIGFLNYNYGDERREMGYVGIYLSLLETMSMTVVEPYRYGCIVGGIRRGGGGAPPPPSFVLELSASSSLSVSYEGGRGRGGMTGGPILHLREKGATVRRCHRSLPRML